MTFLEASRSPPRHSTHHRRRHHHPCDENKSYQISNDRLCLKHPRKQNRSDLVIVNSNRPSQPHTRYDIVENWLAQTSRQSPHSYPRTSQGLRREEAHSYHPSKPLDAIAPYNKHPRRVDPKWSPRHGFPADSLPQSASPFRDLDIRDPRKYRRRRTTLSDSSFISGFGNSTKPPDHGPGPIPHVRRNISPVRSQKKAGLAPSDASSITSHVEEQMNFEKKPRRKTREDRYETKKKKRNHEKEGSGGYEEHRRKKRKRVEKRKSMISSKNVVNNFTSDAVLNERITVQPHLKPGLFENGRTSKKTPILDLAFHEMKFLKHRRRNPQPKPLSKSRLREKRREDREMEEVSSFFLTQGIDKNTQTQGPHGLGPGNNHQNMEYQAGRSSSTRLQGIPEPLLSDHRIVSHPGPIHVSQPPDATVETLSSNPCGYIDDEKESTSYYTWSTSHNSPQVNRRANSSSPRMASSACTTTPEQIRRDLIATGIYRDTGIPFYDDHLAKQDTEVSDNNAKMPNTRRVESGDSNCSVRPKFKASKKVEYRDQAIMTENLTKGPEPLLETQGMKDSHVTAVNRQQIVREIRLNPPDKDNPRQNIRIVNSLDAEATAVHQSPELSKTNTNQNTERRPQETSDPISVASRDAMPPPPIPHGGNESIISPHADIDDGDYYSPKQTLPPTNIETERPQAFHKVNQNNVTQNIQGLHGSYDQTTSLLESNVNNERILESFDTASWIPQRTPSARAIETQGVISRLSLKSPFYVDQYERALSKNSHRKDSTKPQEPESMAEFITRIENESQQKTLLYDDETLGSGLSPERAVLNAPIFDTELSDPQFSAYDERENMHPYLDPDSHLLYTDLENSSMYYRGGGEYYTETLHPQYDIGIPRAFPEILQPLGDFQEERSEMSNFWRPNQFSRF